VLLVATLAWVAFWLGGLPSYYQQYSVRFMVVFVLVVLVPIPAIAHLVLRRVRRQARLRLAGWYAFYFTVPLAFFDWLYCGVFLGHGAQFLARFWYLSIYYAIPWLVLPAVALLLNRQRSEQSKDNEPG